MLGKAESAGSPLGRSVGVRDRFRWWEKLCLVVPNQMLSHEENRLVEDGSGIGGACYDKATAGRLDLPLLVIQPKLGRATKKRVLRKV
jgi:hypothetical protein